MPRYEVGRYHHVHFSMRRAHIQCTHLTLCVYKCGAPPERKGSRVPLEGM